jgi:hypothetical protein
MVLSTPQPTPNLEVQASVFVTLGDRVTQLCPRHWVPILVTFYDTHELRWDYSSPPVTTRRTGTHSDPKFGRRGGGVSYIDAKKRFRIAVPVCVLLRKNFRNGVP